MPTTNTRHNIQIKEDTEETYKQTDCVYGVCVCVLMVGRVVGKLTSLGVINSKETILRHNGTKFLKKQKEREKS